MDNDHDPPLWFYVLMVSVLLPCFFWLAVVLTKWSWNTLCPYMWHWKPMETRHSIAWLLLFGGYAGIITMLKKKGG